MFHSPIPTTSPVCAADATSATWLFRGPKGGLFPNRRSQRGGVQAADAEAGGAAEAVEVVEAADGTALLEGEGAGEGGHSPTWEPSPDLRMAQTDLPCPRLIQATPQLRTIQRSLRRLLSKANQQNARLSRLEDHLVRRGRMEDRGLEFCRRLVLSMVLALVAGGISVALLHSENIHPLLP